MKINDRYVNTGNYLSSDNLTNGQTSTVDIAASEDIFDQNYEPLASEFTIGATATFTANIDFYRKISGTTDAVFDMLDGRDYAHTAGGNDKIAGGAGDDKVNGNDGNDFLTGGDGDDLLNAGSGDDIVFGDAGVDTLIGGAGADTLDGGDGDDVIYGGIGADQINGGDDDDILFGNGDDDIISGDAGNDQILGGLGDDTLRGGTGDDIIIGGDGNDDIDGGTGNDVLIGDDIDLSAGAVAYYNMDEISGTTVLDLSGNDYHGTYIDGTPTWDTTGGHLKGAIDFTGKNFEEINVGTWDVSGSGITLSAWIYQDSIGNDARIISKTNGSATTSHDWAMLIDDNASASGEDRLQFRLATVNGVESNSLEGYNFANYVDMWTHVAVTYDDTSDLITYYINGNAVGTDVHSFGGAVVTGSGKQIAIGNQPDDAYGDRQFEGLIDEVRIHEQELSSAEIYDLYDMNFNGASGTGLDIINGGDGDDTIYGGGGNDTVNAGADDDTILGQAGNDTLNGDAGDDTIFGGGDDDTIYGGAGNDALNGGEGNDIIYANADTGIYDADWSFRRSITIDSSLVDSDMTDFTVLITGAGLDANFWSNVKADGSDILFTLADGLTVLDREVVNIDTVAETLEVHVRVPNLSSTLDTELKLHYGNAGVTLANDATTFGENYTGVWHLDDLAGSVVEDSSRSQLNGTARGGLATGDVGTGVVGDGITFNGTSDYISLQQNYTSATPLVNGVSVTAWINTTVTGVGGFGNWAILDFDRSEFFNVFIDSNTGQLSFSTSASGTDDFSGGANIADGAWHHIAAVYDGTDKILYVDGVEVARKINPHGGADIFDATTRFGFIGDGSEADSDNGGRNNIYYDGQADDVRLYEGVLTADEIAAQFDNQDDPSSFYSVGAVETTLITETDDVDILSGGDGDDILYASSGGDTLIGGDGFDTLYGSSGLDTFVLEAASAFNDVDEIINFRFSEGDILDISDLITGTFSGTITDYVQLVDSGTDTLIQIDSDGLTGGSSFVTAGQFNNITALDEVTLFTDGNIIV